MKLPAAIVITILYVFDQTDCGAYYHALSIVCLALKFVTRYICSLDPSQ